MEVQKEESRQFVEPQFLLQAQASGVTILIGQMNKTEHEGVIRDIGRYEVNLEENGKIVTLLKQEISYITAPHPILTMPTMQSSQTSLEQYPTDTTGVTKPNIQQEFLDKAIRENQVLTLYLMNGQRFKATIEAYDNFTILLTGGGRQHLYYKHSITTINR
ncbi:MAG TPA: RNA chaperone Hfq [Nitrospirota bacterium]|nr:RNA chaperone Hfq [Nitrospirota bacterium]